ALPQLAHQPPRQCRGHRADHPCPGRHGLAQLLGRPVVGEGGLPAPFLQTDARIDPGGAPRTTPAPRMERRLSTPASSYPNRHPALGSGPISPPALKPAVSLRHGGAHSAASAPCRAMGPEPSSGWRKMMRTETDVT